MTEETRAIFAAKHEADRTLMMMIATTLAFGLLMFAGLVQWEHQLKREDLAAQENVSWK